MNRFFLVVSVILLALGIKMIYDARPIIRRYFSFGQENEAIFGMKVIGFLITIIGCVIFGFNINYI